MFKKFLAALLCAATVLAMMPLTASAKKNNGPYAEIKFADAEKENIPYGEAEEIYLDYSAGDCEDYEIVWYMSNPVRWPMEEVTDEETGLVKSVRVEGAYTGYFTLTAEVVSSEGEVIAAAERRIWVVAPDTRTFWEKVGDELSGAAFALFL